ncbi:MAG: hypothetical protein RLZZ574_2374 [Cyanobacteriota bacterium]|jgi:hypothetical protein
MLELTELKLNNLELSSKEQETVKGGAAGAIGGMSGYAIGARYSGNFSGRAFWEYGLGGALVGALGSGTLRGAALSEDK